MDLEELVEARAKDYSNVKDDHFTSAICEAPCPDTI